MVDIEFQWFKNTIGQISLLVFKQKGVFFCWESMQSNLVITDKLIKETKKYLIKKMFEVDKWKRGQAWEIIKDLIIVEFAQYP